MRPLSVVVALVGITLAACGDPAPSGGPVPPASPAGSLVPVTTTEPVPGTGEPYDPAARLRPELVTISPERAAPGDRVELGYPQQTERGVAFVLERAIGETWSTTHLLTSSTDGYDSQPSSVSVDAAEGYAWEDIGIAGPGPDHLLIPDDATPGPYRICTANARENFCAEIDVIDGTPVTTTSESTTPVTTTPVTTTPVTTTPVTTTPVSTTVPVVAVHEEVSFYPACGNETLTFEGRTWYQLNHLDGYDEDYATIYQEFADAERDPSPVVGTRGFAPAVVEPGPGDDVGTLVIWADGVARWVSNSGDLDVWMVDDEITYDWVC